MIFLKPPDELIEYWVFFVHLKSFYLLFWLIIKDATTVFWQRLCWCDILKLKTIITCKPNISLNSIFVLFRSPTWLSTLQKKNNLENWTLSLDGKLKTSSCHFQLKIGIYILVYIFLRISPIARHLLVKWTLCRVNYISTSQKATQLSQSGTFY